MFPQSKKKKKALEIGTGCGYQSAVLAPFAQHLYSVERQRPLIRRARERLSQLKINNVTLRHADGWRGWKSQAPFQGILVAASPPEVPQELLEQLDEGGRLVIPIGRRDGQRLQCITRRGNVFETEELGLVSFVPLVKGIDG